MLFISPKKGRGQFCPKEKDKKKKKNNNNNNKKIFCSNLGMEKKKFKFKDHK